MSTDEQAALGGFHDQPWADRALCAQTDPDAWFPEKGGSTREVKRVCLNCDVRDECLTWALATEQRFGVWGGKSERERRQIRKQQPALAATGTDDPAGHEVVDQADATDAPTPVSRGTYISGTSHRPIPLATAVRVRPAHKPQKPRPTGLDWSKHTAPDAAPAQPAPQQTSRRRDTAAGTAAAEDLVAARFTAPTHPAPLEDATDATDATELPTEGNQGQPTTRPSAPRATSTSSTSGRAPDAGPSTTREKNPPAAQETRPAAAGGPTAGQRLDELIDELATIRANLTTQLTTVETALEAVRQILTDTTAASTPPPAPVAAPSSTHEAATGPTSRAFERPKTRRRSSIDTTKIQQLYVDDMRSIPQIAQQLNHSNSTIRRALLDAGVTLRDDRTRNSGGRNAKTVDDYDPQLVATIRRLYLDEEHTTAQIAEDLGHTPKYVTTILKRAGVPMRPAVSVAGRKGRDIKLDDTRRADICRRYQDGESSVTLAAAYDVSTPTVLNVLRRHGVPVRSKSSARKNHLNQQEAQSA